MDVTQELARLLKEAPWWESFEDSDRIVKENNVKVMAEIGVCVGTHIQYLLLSNPELKVYAVDPWHSYKNLNPNEQWEDISQDLCDQQYKEAVQNLGHFTDRVVIIRSTSQKAVTDFVDGSLDLVYIDAIHDYDNVQADIAAWSIKVKKGGVISGHDYCPSFLGSMRAIEEASAGKNFHSYPSSVWWFLN